MHEWGGATDRSFSPRSATAADGVAWWELDPDTGALRWQENKPRRLGYEPGRIDHWKQFADLLPVSDRADARAAMAAHLAGDTESYDVTYRIRASDGSSRRFHDVGSVTDRDDSGRPTGVAGVSVDVTDHHRREDERRLKSQALDQAPTGIAVSDSLDDDEPIVYVNETFERMTGYAAADVLGRNCRFMQCDETDPEHVAAMREAITAGEATTVELRNERADGSRFWNEVQLTPLRAADGTVTNYVGFQRDVTERKEHEHKLRQLRERSQAMMHTQTVAETVEVAIEMVDRIVGAPLSGFNRLDADGDTLAPCVVADGVVELFDEQPAYERDAPPGSRAALVWRVFEAGEPRWMDDVHAVDGLTEETPARSVLLAPIAAHGLFIVSSPEPEAYSDSDKALVDIVVTMLETALDRVSREEQLRERERRLARQNDRMEGLLGATEELLQADSRERAATLAVTKIADVLALPNACLWLHDADADVLEPVAFTDDVSETVGEPPTYCPDEESLSWRAFETGTAYVLDDLTGVPGRHNDDTVMRSEMVLPLAEYGVINIGSTAADAFDGTDATLAKLWAGTVTQVFARLDNERRLVARNAELTRERDRLDEFAAVVSHDLRNPLNVVQGSLELAAATGEEEQFERAQTAITRIDDLVEDLLSLARAGGELSASEPVALGTLAERCWQTVSTTDATLAVEPAAQDAAIRADPRRLRQLLENLFRNSVEHSSTSSRATPGDSIEHRSTGPHSQAREDSIEHRSTGSRNGDTGVGGDTVSITVGALANGFFVEDDGPGIPASERERVCDHGYSTATDGTGLGLSIVAEVAAAHGWQLDVTESSDGGARFEFTGVERDGEP
jgi:PAS domain S-box-containing protein